MSHYTVVVFHRPDQDVKELLAPYDGNIEVEPYIMFSREQAIEYARKYYKTDGMTDEECWKLTAGDSETDEAGNIYSTYNPQSKWDWWEEGGRWDGMLMCNGKRVSSCRVGDVTPMFDQELYEDALRCWDIVVEHKPPKDDAEEYRYILNEDWLKERYGDRETYARQQGEFSSYAVVTPDGGWHAPGEMGWFGCSSESAEEARDWYDHYKERFIDTADPDWILTIVDCHI